MLEPAKKNKGEGASSVHTRCTVKNLALFYSIGRKKGNSNEKREKKSREIVMEE